MKKRDVRVDDVLRTVHYDAVCWQETLRRKSTSGQTDMSLPGTKRTRVKGGQHGRQRYTPYFCSRPLGP